MRRAIVGMDARPGSVATGEGASSRARPVPERAFVPRGEHGTASGQPWPACGAGLLAASMKRRFAGSISSIFGPYRLQTKIVKVIALGFYVPLLLAAGQVTAQAADCAAFKGLYSEYGRILGSVVDSNLSNDQRCGLRPSLISIKQKLLAQRKIAERCMGHDVFLSNYTDAHAGEFTPHAIRRDQDFYKNYCPH